MMAFLLAYLLASGTSCLNFTQRFIFFFPAAISIVEFSGSCISASLLLLHGHGVVVTVDVLRDLFDSEADGRMDSFLR